MKASKSLHTWPFTFIGGGANDTFYGGIRNDKFILNTSHTGTDTVKDFEVDDASTGDKIQIKTATGNERTLADLRLAVEAYGDNGEHAAITGHNNPSRVYMILEGVTAAHIMDNFDTYFDVI